MKKVKFALATALLVSVPIVGSFSKDDSIRIDGWKIERTGGAISYLTNGQEVHGHEFGFFKLYNHCDQDLISITLSSRSSKVMSYKGTRPEFGLVFDKSKDFVPMPIEYVAYKAWHENLIVMSFTNTEVTSGFMKLVENNPRVLVKLQKPAELSSLMDIEVEGFALKGFSKARIKARELCRKGAI